MPRTEEPETIRFRCPRCERICQVGAHWAGEAGRCPACRQALQVPRSSARGTDRYRAKRAEAPARSARITPTPPVSSLADAVADVRLEDPHAVPFPLRACGTGLILANTLLLLFLLVRVALNLEAVTSNLVVLVLVGLPIAAAAAGLALGVKLLQGQTDAVKGLILLASLVALGGLGLASLVPDLGLIVLGIGAVLYGAPIHYGLRERARLGGELPSASAVA